MILQKPLPAPEEASPPLGQVVPLPDMKGVGFLAERFVADSLEAKGWCMLQVNWRTPFAELDWVA